MADDRARITNDQSMSEWQMISGKMSGKRSTAKEWQMISGKMSGKRSTLEIISNEI